MSLFRGSLLPVLLLLATGAAPSAPRAAAPARPNIVFILTDDQDLTLGSLGFMPRTRALLGSQGTTFANYFVPLSLCCPSRSTILTGLYPHNHEVYTNFPPDGGFERFDELGHENATVATALHAAGYRTALVGKYLNGYPGKEGATYVPPGWDEWASPVAGSPYDYKDYKDSRDNRDERASRTGPPRGVNSPHDLPWLVPPPPSPPPHDRSRSPGRRSGAPEHRVHPDRRPGPHARLPGLHAAHPRTAREPGHDLRQLLRAALPLLPVALHHPDRPLSAQPRGLHELPAGRRLRALRRARPRERHGGHGPACRRLPHGPGRQVPERLPGEGGRHLRAARLGRVGQPRRGQPLRRLPLHAERERQDGEVRQRHPGLRHGRAGGQGGRLRPRRGGGREAVLPLLLHLRAPPAGHPRAPPRQPLPGPPGAAHPLLQRGGRARQAGPHPRPAAPQEGADRGDRRPLPQAGALPAGRGRGGRRPGADPPGDRPARQHLRDLHLGQRLPHGAAPPAAGQVHPLRDGHPRAAAGPRPGRAGRRDRAGAGVERRPRAHLRRAGGRHAAGGRPLPGSPAAWAGAGRVAPEGAAGAVRLPARPAPPRASEILEPPDGKETDGYPAHVGFRTGDLKYVEYETGEREVYDLRKDPDERGNLRDRTSPAWLAEASRIARELARCKGAGCRRLEEEGQ